MNNLNPNIASIPNIAPSPAHPCLKVMVAVSAALTLIAAYAVIGHFIPTIAIASIPLIYSSIALSVSFVTFSVTFALLFCRKEVVSTEIQQTENSPLVQKPSKQVVKQLPRPAAATLPDEIWLEIFKFVDPESFISIPPVSQRFNKLAKNQALAKHYNRAIVCHIMIKSKKKAEYTQIVVVCEALRRVGFPQIAQKITRLNTSSATQLPELLTRLAQIENDPCNATTFTEIIDSWLHNKCRDITVYSLTHSLLKKHKSQLAWELAFKKLWSICEIGDVKKMISKSNYNEACAIFYKMDGPTKAKVIPFLAKHLAKANQFVEVDRIITQASNLGSQYSLDLRELINLLHEICTIAIENGKTDYAESRVYQFLSEIENAEEEYYLKYFNAACSFALHLHQLGRQKHALSLVRKIKTLPLATRLEGICSVAMTELITSSQSVAKDTLNNWLLTKRSVFYQMATIIPCMLALQMQESAEQLFRSHLKDFECIHADFRRQNYEVTSNHYQDSWSTLKVMLLELASMASLLQNEELEQKLLNRATNLLPDPILLTSETYRFYFECLCDLVLYHAKQKNYVAIKKVLTNHRALLQAASIYHDGSIADDLFIKGNVLPIIQSIISIARHEAKTDPILARETIRLIPSTWANSRIEGILALGLEDIDRPVSNSLYLLQDSDLLQDSANL